MARRAESIPIQLPGGAQIAVRLRGTAPGAPVVVIVPGLGVPAKHYDFLGAELTGLGLNTATIELRGHGESTPKPGRGSTYGYHELVSVDFPAAFAVIRERFEFSATVLLGHSLGGHLSMLYAARARNRIRGVVLVASGSPHHKVYGKRSPTMLLGGTAVALASNIAGFWPGDMPLAGGFGRQSKVLMNDWAAFARTGRLDPAGADVNYEERLATLRTPTLAITIEGDDLIPERSARALLEKMPAAPTALEHEPKPLGHNGWIADPRGVAARVATFVTASIGSTGTRRPANS